MPTWLVMPVMSRGGCDIGGIGAGAGSGAGAGAGGDESLPPPQLSALTDSISEASKRTFTFPVMVTSTVASSKGPAHEHAVAAQRDITPASPRGSQQQPARSDQGRPHRHRRDQPLEPQPSAPLPDRHPPQTGRFGDREQPVTIPI